MYVEEEVGSPQASFTRACFDIVGYERLQSINEQFMAADEKRVLLLSPESNRPCKVSEHLMAEESVISECSTTVTQGWADKSGVSVEVMFVKVQE